MKPLSFFAMLAAGLLLTALAARSLSAAEPVVLEEGRGCYRLGWHLDLLPDEGNGWTIEEVASPEFASRFSRSREETPNFGFTKTPYWVRFQLLNKGRREKRLLLKIGFPLLDHADLFVPNGTGEFTQKIGGELVPLGRREVQLRYPVFLLTVPPGPAQTYYLRCQDNGSAPLPLTLWEETAFLKRVNNERLLLGIYYGALLSIILYNSLIFLTVRIRSYLYYVLFASLYLCWQMIYNGLANEYLWPASPWITHRIMPILICVTGASATQFTRAFLDTGKNVPRLHTGLSLLMAAYGATALLALLPRFAYPIPVAALLSLFFAPMALLAGFLCWNKVHAARYFSIAWFGFLCGTMLLSLKSFALLPSNFITEYGQQIGSLLEIALLSLALTDQFRKMRQEKELAQATALRLQKDAARRLEEQVEQRTGELRASKRKLEILSAKLAKYLAPQVYAAVFAGRNDVKRHSSRKKLTVFFSDIKGFTELTDSIESEPLTGLLNDYLNQMAEIALQHGGTIDKYIGDAIMIFFGDPETRGEKADALACVEMALAMRQRMREFQKKWQSLLLPKPLQIRMGVNTGYCTVGNFGSEERLDYTIIGGQVNMSSRLESLAEPDQILISYQTYVLIKDTIACEPKGEIRAKGLAYPILTYQVIDRHENLVHRKNEIQAEGEGYSIALDFNRISGAAATRLTQSLQKALALLEPGEG